MLTSALKGVDTAVFLTVKAVQDGTFQGGGNADFGLDQEGVGLGKFSPNASKTGHRSDEEGRAGDRRRADLRHPDDGRLAPQDGGEAQRLTPSSL